MICLPVYQFTQNIFFLFFFFDPVEKCIILFSIFNIIFKNLCTYNDFTIFKIPSGTKLDWIIYSLNVKKLHQPIPIFSNTNQIFLCIPLIINKRIYIQVNFRTFGMCCFPSPHQTSFRTLAMIYGFLFVVFPIVFKSMHNTIISLKNTPKQLRLTFEKHNKNVSQQLTQISFILRNNLAIQTIYITKTPYPIFFPTLDRFSCTFDVFRNSRIITFDTKHKMIHHRINHPFPKISNLLIHFTPISWSL